MASSLALYLIVSGGVSARPLVVDVLSLVRDFRNLLLWEEGEQVPSLVEGFEDGPVLLERLLDELALESIVKEEVVVVLGGKGILTDDGLHGLGVLALRIEGVHLAGDLWMVRSCHVLADSVLHETGQGRQYVDWWVDASSEHVSVDIDLTLRDVASQVGNRMGDIIVRHCKNGELCDGTVLAFDTTGSLVDS